eukprot:TRINITY_DN9742_c0_g1_i1.p1 TRINITY_DN9742_c0_g1~~TRINITY_DN9742_c0_g1_i1.p1  ORF type:complete len:642 (-),score=117.11 TRINITY_DN9742_c0_g1_i1:65-1990(-)
MDSLRSSSLFLNLQDEYTTVTEEPQLDNCNSGSFDKNVPTASETTPKKNRSSSIDGKRNHLVHKKTRKKMKKSRSLERSRKVCAISFDDNLPKNDSWKDSEYSPRSPRSTREREKPPIEGLRLIRERSVVDSSKQNKPVQTLDLKIPKNSKIDQQNQSMRRIQSARNSIVRRSRSSRAKRKMKKNMKKLSGVETNFGDNRLVRTSSTHSVVASKEEVKNPFRRSKSAPFLLNAQSGRRLVTLDTGEKAFYLNNLIYTQTTIIAASIDRIVDIIVGGENSFSATSKFVDVILSTHTSYIDSIELLEMLWEKFDIEETDDETKTRKEISIANFLKKWIKNYPRSILANEQRVFNRLLDFIEHIIESEDAGGDGKMGLYLKTILKHQIPENDGEEHEQMVEEFDSVINFKKLDPDVFSQQLTLLHRSLFDKVNLESILKYPSDDETLNEPLLAIGKLSTMMHKWIVTEITSETSVEKRSKKINFFLLVILKLQDLNNFHGAFDIFQGCSNFLLERLKKTWSKVPKDRWRSIKNFFSVQNNYQTLRTSAAQSEGSCIFPLALTLRDLSFINETDLLWEGSELLNFQRYYQVYDKGIAVFYKASIMHDFVQVPEIQWYLNNLPYEEEDEIDIHTHVLVQLEQSKKK